MYRRQETFDTTSWTIVLAAKDDRSEVSKQALNELCQTYWPPLYAYLRSKGHSDEDARDLTQGFFAHLLEKHFLLKVEKGHGRFRSYLLVALNHFLTDTWRKESTQRRGGPGLIPVDFAAAEERYAAEAMRRQATDPRIILDKEWANTLLESVLNRLQQEFESQGKAIVFDALKEHLIAVDASPPYKALGEQLSMSEGAVRVALHRMRKRYAALMRTEVARTMDRPDDVEDELRYLIEVLSS